MTGAVSPTRAVAVAALLLAITIVGYLLLRGDSATALRLQFSNAGGLVEGGEVRVAGRRVGSIDELELNDNGVVEARISVSSDDVTLHEGARATIRAIGQATITNNFIELQTGSDAAPQLSDGALIPNSHTREIVNVDAVLQSFGREERANLSGLVEHGAEIYAGSGARYFNQTLGKLNPAMQEINGVATELDSDQAALKRFIVTAARTTTAVADRQEDLRGAVLHSARTFGAIAREREPLAELLERAPGVLTQARGTLAIAGDALVALRPTLRDVPPAAGPLRALLSNLTPTLRQAQPAIAQTRSALPPLRRGLAAVPAIEDDWVAAFRSLAKFKSLRHIVKPLMSYAPDLLVGVPNGLAGLAVGSYNAHGHYIRLEFVQNPETLSAGFGAPLLNEGIGDAITKLPASLFDVRTKLTRRCPGAAVPPAPDGSTPIALDESLCDLSQTQFPEVNQP